MIERTMNSMIRQLSILTIILFAVSAVQAQEFPPQTPVCGKVFITFYETGSMTDKGFVENTLYRSVRKSDILSLHKFPEPHGYFGITLRIPEKPGYDHVRVAPNTYMKILECLD